MAEKTITCTCPECHTGPKKLHLFRERFLCRDCIVGRETPLDISDFTYPSAAWDRQWESSEPLEPGDISELKRYAATLDDPDCIPLRDQISAENRLARAQKGLPPAQ